jgi:hypothetical protein
VNTPNTNGRAANYQHEAVQGKLDKWPERIEAALARLDAATKRLEERASEADLLVVDLVSERKHAHEARAALEALYVETSERLKWVLDQLAARAQESLSLTTASRTLASVKAPPLHTDAGFRAFCVKLYRDELMSLDQVADAWAKDHPDHPTSEGGVARALEAEGIPRRSKAAAKAAERMRELRLLAAKDPTVAAMLVAPSAPPAPPPVTS